MSLRERHSCKAVKQGGAISRNDVVLIEEDHIQRQRLKMGVVSALRKGADAAVRGVMVRCIDKRGKPFYLNRPLQRLFPFEFADQPDESVEDIVPDVIDDSRPPRRQAAINADVIRNLTSN